MPVLDKDWLNLVEGWPPAKRFKSSRQENEESANTCQKEDYKDINYKLIAFKSRTPVKSTQFVKATPQKRFSPRDHRNIAIIAYFSRMQESASMFSSIHHVRPYRVPWSKLAMHVCHMRVDYDQLFRAFNASLVGLCQTDPANVMKI